MNNIEPKTLYTENIDLTNREALEWLVFYSSQSGINELQNTLLVDLSNNIIWFKYNWVDKINNTDKWYFRPLVVTKNNNIKNFEWFYFIDINKIFFNIPYNIKYNSTLKKEITEIFLKYIKTKNKNVLFDNLKKYDSKYKLI